MISREGCKSQGSVNISKSAGSSENPQRLEKSLRMLMSLPFSDIQSDLFLKVALCEIIDLTVPCKWTCLFSFEEFPLKGPGFLSDKQRSLSHFRTWVTTEWQLNNFSFFFVKKVVVGGQQYCIHFKLYNHVIIWN